jgi:tRNA dimethylallyltransferase
MQLALEAWFLSGPTAVGKTAVALALAKRIGAEIVSMDSMAIYRGMDIGTAKPTPSERRQVPHHLIDLVDPHEDFSLAHYLAAAQAAAAEILTRGRQVLFAGGTPLYLKGLLRGIFQGPPADWEFRRAIMAEAAANGADWLHARLHAVDPVVAARLHSNDTRRLVRALEVFHVTGRPISELQRQFDRATPTESCRVFVLDRPKAELLAWIDRRVDDMFAEGLVDEVRRLLGDCPDFCNSKNGTVPFVGRLSKTARQAVGYGEVIDYLEGRHDLTAAIELIKTHSRQLAKRQATWFRSLSECRFIGLEGEVSAEEVAQRIVSTAAKTLAPS